MKSTVVSLSWDEVMIGVCIGAENIFLYYCDLLAYSYAEGGRDGREREREGERVGEGERPFSFMQLHLLNVILY